MADKRYTLRLHSDCDTEAAIAAHLDGLRSGRRAEIIRRLVIAGWHAQQGGGQSTAPVTVPAPARPVPAPSSPEPVSDQESETRSAPRPPTDDPPPEGEIDELDPMAKLRRKLGVGGAA